MDEITETKWKVLNRDTIKYIAMFTMLLNHISKIFMESGNFVSEVTKAAFNFFFESFPHINKSVNIGASKGQSEARESKIRIKIETTFNGVFLTLSTTKRIQKHINNVKSIFSPQNSNTPFFVKARQYGISEIKAYIINLKAYFFFEWVY